MRNYVEMQWLMLQQKRPEDYVIATGSTFRQDFIDRGPGLDMPLRWMGSGVKRRAVNPRTGATVVAVDSRYFRRQVETLLGDASRPGGSWAETKVTFENLVRKMSRTSNWQRGPAL